MVLVLTIPEVLQINIMDYVKSIVHEFPEKLFGKTSSLWNENPFKVDLMSKKLDAKCAKFFHIFVMKGMFLSKHGCYDIQSAITFMATRVTETNEEDWTKLKKLLNFLKATQDEIAAISVNDTNSIKWHVDAVFAVYKDFRSYTGITISLSAGVISYIFTK